MSVQRILQFFHLSHLLKNLPEILALLYVHVDVAVLQLGPLGRLLNFWLLG